MHCDGTIDMEKEKVVAEFFKHGHLLTEEALKLLDHVDDTDWNLPLVVDAGDIQKPYRIIKNITSKKTELKSDDFVKFFNSKYEKMKAIITSRINKDFISLNKIGNTRGEVYTIGIVRDIKDKDGKKIVEIEDTTASIPVIFDSVDVELDDVIAVQAIEGGKVLFGKKILYPDIPLRKPTAGRGKGCFVSDLCLDESPRADAEKFFQWFGRSDVQYLFVAGRIGDLDQLEKYVEQYCYIKTVFLVSEEKMPGLPIKVKNSRIVSLSNPAMVDVGGLKILMAQRADATMLKKRHLGKSDVITEEDYMALDEIPDVVHSGNSAEPYITNYKSVTLVNSGSLLGTFRPVVIDFSTRDADLLTVT